MSEIMVKVAKLGAEVKEVCVADGSTIGQAITAAGYSADGFQIRKDSREVATTEVASNNDLIVLQPAVKGGRE